MKTAQLIKQSINQSVAWANNHGGLRSDERLLAYLMEEVGELAEAVIQGSFINEKEELGDVIYAYSLVTRDLTISCEDISFLRRRLKELKISSKIDKKQAILALFSQLSKENKALRKKNGERKREEGSDSLRRSRQVNWKILDILAKQYQNTIPRLSQASLDKFSSRDF